MIVYTYYTSIIRKLNVFQWNESALPITTKTLGQMPNPSRNFWFPLLERVFCLQFNLFSVCSFSFLCLSPAISLLVWFSAPVLFFICSVLPSLYLCPFLRPFVFFTGHVYVRLHACLLAVPTESVSSHGPRWFQHALSLISKVQKPITVFKRFLMITAWCISEGVNF